MESRLNMEKGLVSQRLYGLEFGGGSELDLSLIGEAILGHRPEPAGTRPPVGSCATRYAS